MNIKSICVIAILIASSIFSIAADSIRESIDRELTHHPYSTYQDIYKSFFQDRFGPGHILADTIKSRAYLQSELKENSIFKGPLYEPTGQGCNFVRVNLSIIKQGLLSENDFFHAFVDGLQQTLPPDIKEWRNEWVVIDSVLTKSYPNIDKGEISREMILEKISAGKPTVHHSHKFDSLSDYHYRIISRKIFERQILPLLESKTNQAKNF